jgi:hypothetical protein
MKPLPIAPGDDASGAPANYDALIASGWWVSRWERPSRAACECGSQAVGSPKHSEWCPRTKAETLQGLNVGVGLQASMLADYEKRSAEGWRPVMWEHPQRGATEFVSGRWETKSNEEYLEALLRSALRRHPIKKREPERRQWRIGLMLTKNSHTLPPDAKVGDVIYVQSQPCVLFEPQKIHSIGFLDDDKTCKNTTEIASMRIGDEEIVLTELVSQNFTKIYEVANRKFSDPALFITLGVRLLKDGVKSWTGAIFGDVIL